MMQQVLSHYHLPLLACLGLLIFFGVFIGALGWVYRNGSGRFYQSMGTLPLLEDDHSVEHGVGK